MSEQSSANDEALPTPPYWDQLTTNQKTYLAALKLELGHVTKAALRCGMSRWAHVSWKRNSEAYRDALRELKDEIDDTILREFYRRGVEGVQQPVFYKGKQVATQMVYDTTALIALAKARMPKKFRENFKGHIQLDGGVDHHLRHEALLAPEFLEQLLNAATQLKAGPDGHGSEAAE